MVVERLRGRAGQKQRRRRLERSDGLCEMCLTNDIVRAATIVDHIVPLIMGGSDDDNNTRNLCDEHDAIVTAEQFGHAAPIEGAGIGRDGRPTSADHPWNRHRARSA